MGFDDFLYQTCTISRPTAGSAGRYNQNELTLVEVDSDVPCRMIEKTVRILDEKTHEYAWVKATVLLFRADADVQSLDQIVIDDQDGTWVAKQCLERRALNGVHHVSMIVEALNG